MPHKPIITTEEKIKIVEACIQGKESMNGAGKRYGVSKWSVRTWIRLYKERGAEGLKPASKNRKYTVEVKKRAVEKYLSGKGSLNEICEKYNITDAHMLRKWIIWYNSHGECKQGNNGGEIYMTKGGKTTLEERIEMVSDCVANNKDYRKTIEKYNVSYNQIYGWVRKYERDGVEALTDNRGKRIDECEMSEIGKLNAELKLKEAENNRLRMENELLKKLEALERGIDKN